MTAAPMRALLVQVLAPRGSRRRRSIDGLHRQGAASTEIVTLTVDPSREATASTRVLVVDHRLPSPDFDSGSVRLTAILRALQSFGCFVRFVPADRSSYDGKLDWPTSGVDAVTLPHQLSRYLRGAGHDVDICWIVRPEQSGAFRRMVHRRSPQAVVVYDTVDLHEPRLRSMAQRTGTKADRLRAAQVARLERRAIRSCDLALVITDGEAETVRQQHPGKDVAVIPNIHDVAERMRPDHSTRSGLLFIGGFEHHPNVDAVEYIIDDLAHRLAIALPDVSITIVGASPPTDLVARAPGNVEFLGWVENIAQLQDDARLSIAPLRYGAGMKGKVGEAMAAGLPVVTTSVGAEGFGATHGTHLLVADDAASFVDAVVRAYTDGDAWRVLAVSGRALIEERFSTAAGRRRVRELLERLHRVTADAHREQSGRPPKCGGIDYQQ